VLEYERAKRYRTPDDVVSRCMEMYGAPESSRDVVAACLDSDIAEDGSGFALKGPMRVGHLCWK